MIGSTPATSFPDAPFGVSVALDALNQASFAVWGQNGLVRTVYPGKKYPGFKLDPLVAAPALLHCVNRSHRAGGGCRGHRREARYRQRRPCGVSVTQS